MSGRAWRSAAFLVAVMLGVVLALVVVGSAAVDEPPPRHPAPSQAPSPTPAEP